MLTSMARRPPVHAHHMNGLHHQPYQSKTIQDEDDNEEEREARRARSRILANKLSESLLCRSSSSNATSNNHHQKDDSIEQRIKTAIDLGDVDTLRDIYSQSSCPIKIECCFKSGGWTALIHSAYACHFNLVHLFVSELGADVNKTSSEGMSPLMACCMSSHSKSSTNHGNDEQLVICRYLLEHGAQIEPASDSNDHQMMSPLMLAARFGCSPPLIRLLVDYGAKIDRRDSKGWSPLIMATQHGHLGSVEALICSGADLKSATNNGLTALDIAQHLKYETIAQYLVKQYSNITISSPPSASNERSDDQTTIETSSIDQSWKPMSYVGLATAIGGALLLSVVYLRR